MFSKCQVLIVFKNASDECMEKSRKTNNQCTNPKGKLMVVFPFHLGCMMMPPPLLVLALAMCVCRAEVVYIKSPSQPSLHIPITNAWMICDQVITTFLFVSVMCCVIPMKILATSHMMEVNRRRGSFFASLPSNQ